MSADAAEDAANLIQNPSFETAAANGNPANWAKGGWGSNTRVFTYPVSPGYNSEKAAKVEITNYTTGDAKWYFTDVPVVSGKVYKFSNYYNSNVQSYLTVRLTKTNGTFQYMDIGKPEASADWQQFVKVFTMPADVTSISVFHVIKSVGSLTVDNYSFAETADADPSKFPTGMISLNFDDGHRNAYDYGFPIITDAGLKASFYIITKNFGFPGYVNQQEVLNMQAAGHEIGSHSRTHKDLTTLSQSELHSEIAGSREDLLAIGVRSVTTFVYPFGAYNRVTNALVKQIYEGTRTSNGGVTDKNEDPLLLERRAVQTGVTMTQVKGWIDDAVKNKRWQILVFHNIDTTGGPYSTTPAMLQEITDYIKANNVPVVTVAEGTKIMKR